MEDAAAKEDWPAVLDHIYPKYMDAYGGKDGLLRKYKSQWEFMNSHGNEFSIKKITIGDPGNEIKIGTMLYSFVPETRVFRLNSTNYQMLDYLIGISSDGGEHWTFLVGQKSNVIRALLPDISTLNIPKASTPRALID